MKIGLVTIYQVPNYGSVLQAYATQFLLERLGAECHIINYKYPNEWHWQHGARKPHGLRAFIRKFIPSKKAMVLQRFREKYYRFTSTFHNLDALKNANWDNYDAFVVGSDQVWNARYVLGDSVFMLSFVPSNKPRYSIASSFALKSLPEQYREKYFKELVQFTALSVREQNGVGIINDELNIKKEVNVILDPTLLLSKDDWMKTIPRSTFKKERPYILFYMWTYAFEPRPYIFDVLRFFSEKLDYEIIALEGYTSYKNCGLQMQNRCSSSIEEFIDIFANADMVITSSFHGTAFALNFGIPLVSIVPDGEADDRQTTLLYSMDCKQSATKIGTNLADINPYYNVMDVQDRLEQHRNNDIDWIKKSIYDK